MNMSDFRFDPISYVIGLASGLGLSLIVYRLRNLIKRARLGASGRAESARRFATRTADARYQIDIRNYCQQYHLAGEVCRLSDVLVEPRFIRGMETYDTTGDRKLRDVFHVVPLIHRFPAGYAPFNIKTLGIEDLGAGDRHLALLGRTGSGRSTALAAIALWAMGEIEFEKAEDIVQQSIEEEDAQLDDKQRAAREKERAEIQARALEQIQSAQDEASETLGAGDRKRERINFHRLMPILVHLNDVVVDPDMRGQLDPAEPLVQAIRGNVRRVTALTVPRYVYDRLNDGQALVLLDGLDDLPNEEQSAKLAWLGRFVESYPNCVIIVAGSVSGYISLRDLGLTPMFLRPWMDIDVLKYAEKWAAAWPHAARKGRRLAIAPDERTIRVVTTNTRGLTPMDVSARIMATFANPEQEDQLVRWDWYNHLVTRHFEMKEFSKNEDLADEALFAVARVAAHTLEKGAATLGDIRASIEHALREVEDGGKKEKISYPLDIERFIQMLLKDAALLVARAEDRYEFVHPSIASFLASATLLDPDGERALDQVIGDPAWEHAIPFALAKAPESLTNQAVFNKLSMEPDLLFNNLFELVYWMWDAPANAPWKGEAFKRLAAALIAPAQFPALRERALAALVASRDNSVLFILRQALRSTNNHVRQLGCLGLGALGDTEAIKDLRPMLEDDALEVQLAAGLALGAIGSEKALEIMVDGLLEGEEGLRQAVAEALAAIPGEGHHILHTAVTSEDMMVRRSAVFGLSRIETPWALTDLYRRLLEDDQWYVRSAAEQAFARAQSGAKEVVEAHPLLRDIEWLTDYWREHRGEQEFTEEDLEDMLLQLLTAGDQPYRVAAARTAGYTGRLQALNQLYSVLQDTNENIRTASYAALADIELQIGHPLPGI